MCEACAPLRTPPGHKHINEPLPYNPRCIYVYGPCRSHQLEPIARSQRVQLILVGLACVLVLEDHDVPALREHINIRANWAAATAVRYTQRVQGSGCMGAPGRLASLTLVVAVEQPVPPDPVGMLLDHLTPPRVSPACHLPRTAYKVPLAHLPQLPAMGDRELRFVPQLVVAAPLDLRRAVVDLANTSLATTGHTLAVEHRRAQPSQQQALRLVGRQVQARAIVDLLEGLEIPFVVESTGLRPYTERSVRGRRGGEGGHGGSAHRGATPRFS
jgi:hypothetical protein